MFRPNQNCVIHHASGKTDVYGMPQPATLIKERCSVIKMDVRNEKSAVRADTSASRGNARELQANSEFLLEKTTSAAIDDAIEIGGMMFRIMSVFPRYDLQGNLDHYQVTGAYWSAQ